MRKPIYVYSYDANPNVDPPKFRTSPHDALQRLSKGYVTYLSPNSVQEVPPPGWTPDHTTDVAGGLFGQAWMPRWSACFLVWQMCPDVFS